MGRDRVARVQLTPETGDTYGVSRAHDMSECHAFARGRRSARWVESSVTTPALWVTPGGTWGTPHRLATRPGRRDQGAGAGQGTRARRAAPGAGAARPWSGRRRECEGPAKTDTAG